ncbi:MAG: aspartate kinase [Cellulomonadaceae bacterium]|jgi:aspartate kinase|nr:aspartate kinase [Cellulomonadaceae bacterium]
MSLIVQKYGGSSVSNAAAIKRVAKRVAATQQQGHDVVVVVSAMGDTTDELLDLAGAITHEPSQRELDILLTAGERISMSLLAMAVANYGVQAQSFTGQQAGVITDAVYGRAQIIDVVPHRIRKALDAGNVAIVAGFQGVDPIANDVTTLGRGGSDTTAVAIAAGLGADVCEIYTDVDGVYTADPRIVPTAKKIERATYEEMLELAACGAKILALRSVEYGRRYGVPIHVRSSFSQSPGTYVSLSTQEDSVEAPIISGVAHDRSEAKITIVDVPDVPGTAADIFAAVAEVSANIDMIVQNVSAARPGLTDISFTLPEGDGKRTLSALRRIQGDVGFASFQYDDQIGKVSLVGAGMKSHPGVSARFFAALRDAGINVEMISTSEIRISVAVRADQLDDAVRAIHTAFDLDSHDGEATVYAGTGR